MPAIFPSFVAYFIPTTVNKVYGLQIFLNYLNVAPLVFAHFTCEANGLNSKRESALLLGSVLVKVRFSRLLSEHK